MKGIDLNVNQILENNINVHSHVRYIIMLNNDLLIFQQYPGNALTLDGRISYHSRGILIFTFSNGTICNLIATRKKENRNFVVFIRKKLISVLRFINLKDIINGLLTLKELQFKLKP